MFKLERNCLFLTGQNNKKLAVLPYFQNQLFCLILNISTFVPFGKLAV